MMRCLHSIVHTFGGCKSQDLTRTRLRTRSSIEVFVGSRDLHGLSHHLLLPEFFVGTKIRNSVARTQIIILMWDLGIASSDITCLTIKATPE